jgi:K+-sensing histidine kinase KdpD
LSILPEEERRAFDLEGQRETPHAQAPNARNNSSGSKAINQGRKCFAAAAAGALCGSFPRARTRAALSRHIALIYLCNHILTNVYLHRNYPILAVVYLHHNFQERGTFSRSTRAFPCTSWLLQTCTPCALIASALTARLNHQAKALRRTWRTASKVVKAMAQEGATFKLYANENRMASKQTSNSKILRTDEAGGRSKAPHSPAQPCERCMQASS